MEHDAPTLFGDPPHQAHSGTSRAAAQAVKPTTPTLRAALLAYLRVRGELGATDAEAQKALHMDPSTERPRRVELVRAGLVEDSGERRPTPSGRLAVVWRTARREAR